MSCSELEYYTEYHNYNHTLISVYSQHRSEVSQVVLRYLATFRDTPSCATAARADLHTTPVAPSRDALSCPRRAAAVFLPPNPGPERTFCRERATRVIWRHFATFGDNWAAQERPRREYDGGDHSACEVWSLWCPSVSLSRWRAPAAAQQLPAQPFPQPGTPVWAGA